MLSFPNFEDKKWFFLHREWKNHVRFQKVGFHSLSLSFFLRSGAVYKIGWVRLPFFTIKNLLCFMQRCWSGSGCFGLIRIQLRFTNKSMSRIRLILLKVLKIFKIFLKMMKDPVPVWTSSPPLKSNVSLYIYINFDF